MFVNIVTLHITGLCFVDASLSTHHMPWWGQSNQRLYWKWIVEKSFPPSFFFFLHPKGRDERDGYMGTCPHVTLKGLKCFRIFSCFFHSNSNKNTAENVEEHRSSRIVEKNNHYAADYQNDHDNKAPIGHVGLSIKFKKTHLYMVHIHYHI